MRIFLAVELPDAVRRAVAQLSRRITQAVPACPGAISWVRPDNLHVTVKFFGETPESRVDGIRRAVERAVAARPAFDVAVKGVGAFPDRRAPRVLWAGVSGDGEALAALAECVGASVEPLGFPREAQPFHPHLTVARVRRDHRDVGRALDAAGIFESPADCGRVAVAQVAMFSSTPGPAGSVYDKLWDAPLGG